MLGKPERDRARDRGADLAAATCCSRTCPARRRRCSRARSRSRSRARRSRGSSARPTCSRPTSPASRSSTSVTREFEFRPGPVFANVLLVDEINRAMPKTQSALLEAMAERQVTVDGVDAAAARPVPRARDREPDRAGGDVPAARGAARPLRDAHGARLPATPTRRCAIVSRAARTAIRSTGSSRSIDARRAARAAARAVEDVYVDELLAALDRRARARDARALDGVALGASVRGGLALERTRARLGAAPRPRLRRARRRRAAVPAGARPPASCSTASLPRRRLARSARAARRLARLPRARASALAPTASSRGCATRDAAASARGDGRSRSIPRRRLAGSRSAASPSRRRGDGYERRRARGRTGPATGRLDRLVRLGAPLGRTRRGRVRRPRALRRRGAARRGRRRPAARRWRSTRRRCPGSRSRARCARRSQPIVASAAPHAPTRPYLDFADGEPCWLRPAGATARRADRRSAS